MGGGYEAHRNTIGGGSRTISLCSVTLDVIIEGCEQFWVTILCQMCSCIETGSTWCTAGNNVIFLKVDLTLVVMNAAGWEDRVPFRD
jgi:hypothetical protein